MNVFKILPYPVLLFMQVLTSVSQVHLPGNSYFDASPYIEYIHGNMPLVISVPHGGYEIPEGIPERKGRVASNQDIYTIEIAREIRNTIFSETGKYPFIVINHIHRTRLDANRSIEEAAKGNAMAESTWQAYHNQIDKVEEQIKKQYGKGLFIDLHGHRHKIDRIELGYFMSGDELRLDTSMINSGLLNEYLSIRNLVTHNPHQAKPDQLIRGTLSLGAMLENSGQEVVPSPGIPFPLETEPFFSGGYNTGKHGSSGGGTIDGIQIEISLKTRENPKRREEVAKDIAKSLVTYLGVNYFPDDPAYTSAAKKFIEEAEEKNTIKHRKKR